MMILPPTSFYYQAQQFESRAFISSTNVSSEMTNEPSRLLNVSTRSGEWMFYFTDDFRLSWRIMLTLFVNDGIDVSCISNLSEILSPSSRPVLG
jgi:hypothetical protein